MKSTIRLGWAALLLLVMALPANSQQGGQRGADVRFVADTLVVEAEGSYEGDPDLATLTFDVSTQEKELKQAYSKASQSMRTIVEVAERNGLTKDAIHTGVLTVTPYYEGSRKQKARSYRVQGLVVLKVQDFSKVGPIMDDSIQDGIADFRSLTYSLANEEAAKKKAVADAMQRALGRATVALEQTKQKLGAARSVNLEVSQLVGVAQIRELPFNELVEVREGVSGGFPIFGAAKKMAPPPPPPPVRPEKITISANVQCVFGIER
jgi:uncharacterized protein YggE